MVPGLRSDVGPRMVQSMEMLTGLGIDGKERQGTTAALLRQSVKSVDWERYPSKKVHRTAWYRGAMWRNEQGGLAVSGCREKGTA